MPGRFGSGEWVLGLVVALAGCPSAPLDPVPDSATVDAVGADGGTVDAATIDHAAVDAATVDAPTVDAPAVDVTTVDAAIDAATADAGPPCAIGPDGVTEWTRESVGSGDSWPAPSLAIDSTGVPHLVYQAGSLLMHSVKVGGVFSAETIPITSAAYGSSALAIDDGDAVQVVYSGTAEVLVVATRAPDTGVWTVEDLPPLVPTALPGLVDLRIDSTGHRHLILGGTSGIQYVFEDASGWVVETAESGPVAWISLALDPTDQPHVAWTAGTELHHAWRSSAWSSEVVATYSDYALEGTGIAATSTGAVDILHVSVDDSALSLDHNTYLYTNASGSWTFVASGREESVHPAIEVDGSDHAHVVYQWYSTSAGGFNYVYYASDRSGTWEDVKLPAPGWTSEQRWPAVAIDSLDRAHFAHLGFGGDIWYLGPCH